MGGSFGGGFSQNFRKRFACSEKQTLTQKMFCRARTLLWLIFVLGFRSTCDSNDHVICLNYLRVTTFVKHKGRISFSKQNLIRAINNFKMIDADQGSQGQNPHSGAHGADQNQARLSQGAEGVTRGSGSRREGVVPERGDAAEGAIHPSSSSDMSTLDPLRNMAGPMTRLRAKKLKKALSGLIAEVQSLEEARMGEIKPKMCTTLQVVQSEELE